MKSHSNEFRKLETYWYAKLEDLDFKDIENTSLPDRPLKEWHSSKFSSERSLQRQADVAKYDRVLDGFMNNYSFHEVCALISKPRKCSIKGTLVEQVLELHREGFSEREIARKLKKSRDAVHRTLTKTKEWMRIA